jgi:sugar O-acyltransferase (sialic acid O-acetyltransferase NeuD family)
MWGTTGQARVLAEFAPALGLEVAVFVDNDPEASSPIRGLEVLKGRIPLEEWLDPQDFGDLAGAVAIGGGRGAERLQILQVLRDLGLSTPSLVHPTAFVARDAIVGEGCQLLAASRLGAAARLGEGVILNTGSSVDHECVIGEGVHVAPGAVLTGCIEIGARAFIGPGAIILPRLKIGEDAVIGAGAVVTRDIPPGVVAYGSPARVIRPVGRTSVSASARAVIR